MKYTVVRTYAEGTILEVKLQSLFNEGWQFVRASEYIPSEINNGVRRYGYIEYILAKSEFEGD